VYAILDLETTGLNASQHRIVECALLDADANGVVLKEWSTLVAIPGDGAVGASFLHGITRAMLTDAPTFPEIAGYLASRFIGRIVVGHVLDFDLAHLRSEFARCFLDLPDLRASGICTRELALTYLPPGSHSLAACCAATNVPLEAPHTALGDARATAGLLRYFISRGLCDSAPTIAKVPATLKWPNVSFDAPRITPRSILVEQRFSRRPNDDGAERAEFS
jgi:DNA polymerase-3 subunit epsilon